MFFRLLLSAGLCLALNVRPSEAQGSGSAIRNPELGDPGPKVTHVGRVKPTRARAAAIARTDRQGAGTENGNQPDRAEAGGGGR